MKEELRSASMVSGERCATTRGAPTMRLWCAGSSDTLLSVRKTQQNFVCRRGLSYANIYRKIHIAQRCYVDERRR